MQANNKSIHAASKASRQLLAEPVFSLLKNRDQIDSRALRIRSACEWMRLSHWVPSPRFKSMQIFKSGQFPSLMSEHGRAEELQKASVAELDLTRAEKPSNRHRQSLRLRRRRLSPIDGCVATRARVALLQQRRLQEIITSLRRPCLDNTN